MEALEPRLLLTAAADEPAGGGSAAQLLPDLIVWESQSRGYLYGWTLDTNEIPGRTLLRLSTATPNIGTGPMELRGGAVSGDTQEVFQRIYNDDGSFTNRLAGEFVYHPLHGHIHFEGFAEYVLREVLPGDGVGDVVATGGKTSFCLLDLTRYSTTLPGTPPTARYLSCGQVQGISVGWSDVYDDSLPDQWIDVTSVPNGEYWLEATVDPDDHLLELDETNNTSRIRITLDKGPSGGIVEDRFEPNDSQLAARDMGTLGDRVETALTIHDPADEDYFGFTAVTDGQLTVRIDFNHAVGNLNLEVFDGTGTVSDMSAGMTNTEQATIPVQGGQTYFIRVFGAGGATSPDYDLTIDGPQTAQQTIVASSTDVPVVLPDSEGSSEPGDTVVSMLFGPDVVIDDVNVLLDRLEHTWVGDLHIELTSPAGTTVVLLASQWESPQGILGDEGSVDNFIGTALDDQAATNLADGAAPFTGRFNINHSSVGTSPLSAFIGERARGLWTLTIADWYAGDAGVLEGWGIEVTGRLTGDVNNDGAIDGADVDEVMRAVHDAGTDLLYDMNGDGQVSGADADHFIRDMLESQYGDVNLDGHVDVTDLSILALRFGQAVPMDAAGWPIGDLNGDGVIDVKDLSRLALFYGFAHDHDHGAGGGEADDDQASVDLLREASGRVAYYGGDGSKRQAGAAAATWRHIGSLLESL